MSWYSYYEGREQKEELRRKIAKGGKFKAMTVPQGSRKLATTFWGKAWCDHLESHQDYEYRLPRGRSYLRQGQVYNLQIEPGNVTASVAGSSLYDVHVIIKALASADWKRIKDDCAGRVGSLLDLLAGKLGEGVWRAIADPERGLFPKPAEIRLLCSCPDSANMCKHVAAVLYGVGVLLDSAPELFFVLRSVDPSELLSGAARETLDAAHQNPDAGLAGEDLSALFGIDLQVEAGPEVKAKETKNRKVKITRAAKKKPVTKKVAQAKAATKKTSIKKLSAKKAAMGKR